MTGAKLEILKEPTHEINRLVWSRWVEGLAGAYSDYVDAVGEDPFALGETASVSLLVAGATKAGLVSIAEFATEKRDAEGEGANGRCDLWITCPMHRTSWSFEFKQAFPTSHSSTKSLISNQWRAAQLDAQRGCTESDQRVRGLFVSMSECLSERTASREQFKEIEDLLDTLSRSHAMSPQLAIKLTSSNTKVAPSYLWLRRVNQTF